MKWFRFYSEALQDPKVQALRPELFKAWINLLCLASDQDDRGSLPPLANIAFVLHITPNRAERIVAELVDRGLVDEDDDGRRRMHAWDERQAGGDSGADRMRRYRDRIRAAGETATGYAKHRPAVLERDGHACVYCGATGRLVVDHMVPVTRGGSGDPDNLAAACKSCSAGKAGRLVEEAGYAFADPDAAARYDAVRARLAVTPVTSPRGAVPTPETPPVTPVTVTALKRIELEQELEQEAPPSGGGTRGHAKPAAAGGNGRHVTHEDCVAVARSLFGDQVARVVTAKAADIAGRLGGRFDCYAEALREADRRRRRPGARAIGNLHAYCLKIAPDFLSGVPPAPPVEPVAPPQKSRQERIAELDRKLKERAGK